MDRRTGRESRTALEQPSAEGTTAEHVAGGPRGAGALPDHVEVAVVGAGFSGLGAAIALDHHGLHDFVLVEQADSVGGTWRDNRYPGSACDVPSNLYSFSFAPEPRWSRSFAPAEEIWRYLQGVVDRFGLADRLHLSTEVLRSEWDEQSAVWRLTTSRGPMTARYLVSGIGGLFEPKLPEGVGLETFRGIAFHSARWRHDVDLTGRRVVVVGAGASAVQFVPQIAPQAEHTTVLQRTPPWVLPRGDRARHAWEQQLYAAVPLAQRAVRELSFSWRETNHGSFRRSGAMRRLGEWTATRHLEAQIHDAELRERVRPSYELGCKRVLISDDWYPTLTRPDVSVARAGLAEVRASAVVDTSGVEHPADVLVFGTGFHVTDRPALESTFGRDGVSLAQHWAGSPHAYAGVMTHGFPNVFFLLGPNTGLGHNSVVTMIEAQADYTARLVRSARDLGATRIEVRPDAEQAYDEHVQTMAAPTVWMTGGCASWYIDRNGRLATLWPGTVRAYRRRLKDTDLGAYDLRRPATRHPARSGDGLGDARPADATTEARDAYRSVLTVSSTLAMDDGVSLVCQRSTSGSFETAHDRGPVVVLVHGWTHDHRVWHRQVEALTATGLEVVTFDLREHGGSGRGERHERTLSRLARDIRTVCDDASPDQPVVLGAHSLGGMAALTVMAEAPAWSRDRLQGVVLVSTAASDPTRGGLGLPAPVARGLVAATPWLLERAAADERRGRRRVELPWLTRRTFGTHPRPDDVELCSVMPRSCSAEATLDYHRAMTAHHIDLSCVPDDVPVHVLVGSRDVLTPHTHAAALVAGLPHAALTVCGGAGHQLPLERPDVVSDALLTTARAGASARSSA